MSDHSYKGYVITLLPCIEDRWGCQYIIKESDRIKTVASLGSQTFNSREQAESAALGKAKAFVDQFSVPEFPLASGF